jgi:hypothetical protein
MTFERPHLSRVEARALPSEERQTPFANQEEENIQMKKRWSVLPALAGALLGLASCYPGDLTNIQQVDLVVTAHDDTVTFTSFATYALVDSVVHIDLVDNANDSLLTREHDAVILSEVRAGIEAMGYVEEMDPGNTTPDVIVLVGALAVEKDAYFSYGWWPYWGYYPYWPGYGPGYGWGYPATGKVSYGVGTLVTILLDPNRADIGDMEAPVLWVAAVNGLLGSSSTATAARITTGIRQSFDQSPYLSAN